MPYFCHQVRYTTDGWSRAQHNSQDRFEAVRRPIEQLGGSLRATFLTNGTFDVLAIAEFSEDVTAGTIAAAFAVGGDIATIDSTILLNAREAVALWAEGPAQPGSEIKSVTAVETLEHTMAAVAGGE
jgi:uncharacterized protein with GYD domain